MFKEIGDPRAITAILESLDDVAFALGDVEESRACFREALTIAAGIGAAPTTLYAVVGLARLLARGGARRRAAGHGVAPPSQRQRDQGAGRAAAGRGGRRAAGRGAGRRPGAWAGVNVGGGGRVDHGQRLLTTHLREEVDRQVLTPARYQVACSSWAQSGARPRAPAAGRYRPTSRFYQLCGELAHKKRQRDTVGEEGGNSAAIERLRAGLASLAPMV